MCVDVCVRERERDNASKVICDQGNKRIWSYAPLGSLWRSGSSSYPFVVFTYAMKRLPSAFVRDDRADESRRRLCL